MQEVVLVLAASLATASLLPLVRREAWWIRVFDFPRAQFLLLALFALILLLFSWKTPSWLGMAGLVALGATVLLQAFCMLPYTPWGRKEVSTATHCTPESTLSLLVANVFMRNRQDERLGALIARFRPDIVLLLEPDAWWEQRMRVLEREYPHTVKAPLDNQYGMLLYSRLPVLEPQIKHLVREGVPSMHMRVGLRTGAQVWLHAVHPEPPSPTEADTSLPRDAELLIVGREVAGRDTPTIVAGDLNDVAWSYTTTLFQRISALLDPRKGRGMFNTFHAKVPFLRWPLDHVFHSRHFLLCDMQRLPAFGSDHFPVYVQLALERGAPGRQEAPAAEEADERAAREKIGKVQQKDRL